MFDFVHARSKRLKIVRSTRHRFSSYQHGWRKQENIRHWIISLKLIYAIIFFSLTISSCLNRPSDDMNECSKINLIRIWDLWFAFLGLILIFSLFLDRLKCHNLISSEIIDALQILLLIGSITFVIIGHVQAYYRLWWSSSLQLTCLTYLAIVFLDICPISMAILITIKSLKRRRSWRRIYADAITTSV